MELRIIGVRGKSRKGRPSSEDTGETIFKILYRKNFYSTHGLVISHDLHDL